MLLSTERSVIPRDRVLFVDVNTTLRMSIASGATMDAYNRFLYIFIPRASRLTLTQTAGDTIHRVYGMPITGIPNLWDFDGPRMVNFMLTPNFQFWDIFFWFSSQ